ncbi:MAK10-like protein [Tanacetum coccineum]
MGDENPIRTLGDNSKPSHEGYRNTIELPAGNNVVPLLSDTIRRTIDQSAGDKLRDLNAEESWELLEDLALYDNESWNDPRDFAKLVKAIALPQDVPINKITTSCEIYSGPHDTQYCMKDLEQAFVKYASSHTEEAGEGLVSEFMASQEARLSKFEADFKRQQGEMTKKIDTVLKAITDRIAGMLPSDKVKNPKLNPELFTLPCRLGDSKPFDTLANLGSCVNIIPLYLFKKLNIRLLEETDHIFRLAGGTKSYPVRIIKDIEVHIEKLKLLNDFYVIDIKKGLETPLLVGRGFLATANAVIDCRMPKIMVEEGITRSVFGVKGVDFDEEEAPYWTTLGKGESYKPQPSLDGIGAQTPYYARKDFLDCHLPREWEISRDSELNPFKDTLVFRRMVEFLRAIPINLKCNMWESEDLIKKPINWDKPPKNEDGAWHANIRLIDPDGEEFTKTLQSIPTTRKLSER